MGTCFTLTGEFTTRTKVTKQGVLYGLQSCFELWEKVEPFMDVTRCGKRQKVTIATDRMWVKHSEHDSILRDWLKACELMMDDKILMTARYRHSGDDGEQEYTVRAGRAYLVLNNRIDAISTKIARLTESRNKLYKEREETKPSTFISVLSKEGD
jgi:hypothetical protein